MKRKLLIVITCYMALGLVACGSKSENESRKQVESTSANEIVQTNETEETTSEGKPENDTETDNAIVPARTATAYYEDGTEEILTEDSDGAFLTGNGARYFLGDDGVYRSSGYADLYVEKPEKSDKADVITQDKALEAIKKYCYADNPDLESMIDSDKYVFYWNAETNEAGEIVVLFRSYTGALIRYYIQPDSGETYVTEFVPGITYDEQRTGESFNVRDYIDE